MRREFSVNKKMVRKKIELNHKKSVSIKKNTSIQEQPKPQVVNERQKIRTTGTPPVLADTRSRNEIRRGIINNKRIELFSGQYIKPVNEYDTTILITSYNRYDLLFKQLTQLYTQKTEVNFNVVVINDGSTDNRYEKLTMIFPELILINNIKNNGKQLYWKTVNEGLNKIKEFSTSTVLQIDDDFHLCDSFLDRLIKLYFKKKEEDNGILCLSYHLYDKKHLTEYRWGLRYWVDGGGLYDINFFKEINFLLNEIPLSRWERNPNISTGVWHQVSKKINDFGCVIFKTPQSYAKHLGLYESKMHKSVHSISTMDTYNFIDIN